MTSNEIISTYETLSELTGTMLNAASQGEWDDLAALELRCKSYVGNLMQATPVSLNENEQRTKISIIRTILQNDAKIRALTEPRLHELQNRLHLSQTGQRSVQAYGSQRL
ncbi:MAG: flagellar protein FliT [Sulfuriferula multivorans]|uniref:Flagellar protein FliT n=1 Tax=Sulfuriferula multivorans TaxID=1559896 RepID=A0A7C9K9K7_9PROT|nr:flagellar protein FliT [Sulfuriferula multivorans]